MNFRCDRNFRTVKKRLFRSKMNSQMPGSNIYHCDRLESHYYSGGKVFHKSKGAQTTIEARCAHNLDKTNNNATLNETTILISRGGSFVSLSTHSYLTSFPLTRLSYYSPEPAARHCCRAFYRLYAHISSTTTRLFFPSAFTVLLSLLDTSTLPCIHTI